MFVLHADMLERRMTEMDARNSSPCFALSRHIRSLYYRDLNFLRMDARIMVHEGISNLNVCKNSMRCKDRDYGVEQSPFETTTIDKKGSNDYSRLNIKYMEKDGHKIQGLFLLRVLQLYRIRTLYDGANKV